MNTSDRLALAALVLVFATSGACGAPSDSGNDTEGIYAIVDVNLIPMDSDRVVEHQTVEIGRASTER